MGCIDRIHNYLTVPSRDPQVRGSSQILQTQTTLGNSATEFELSESIGTRGTYSVLIEGASISPSPDSDLAIRTLDAEFARGSVNAIIGPGGSGKTTLLKGILGELPCKEGVISVNDQKIAYCSQTPWLPNTTIKEAICGGSEFEEAWYSTVFASCLLVEDVERFEDHHQSLIGSQGISLSGGQRQRIVSTPLLCTTCI